MFTDTMTSDNAGSPEPITAPSSVNDPSGRYRRVNIREQGGAATAGFRIRVPHSDSSYVEYQAGEAAKVESPSGPIQPGVTIGYIETLSGTLTFSRLWE